MKKDNTTNNITNITQNNNNSNQTNKKSEKETAVDLPHKFFDEKASLVKNCVKDSAGGGTGANTERRFISDKNLSRDGYLNMNKETFLTNFKQVLKLKGFQEGTSGNSNHNKSLKSKKYNKLN